jgi:hypothetical protein
MVFNPVRQSTPMENEKQSKKQGKTQHPGKPSTQQRT